MRRRGGRRGVSCGFLLFLIAAGGCGRRHAPAGSPGADEAPAEDRAKAGTPRAETPAPRRADAEALPAGPPVRLAAFETPSPRPGKTPRATYEAARACVGRRDYLGSWELFSKEARAQVDGSLPPTLGEWRYFRLREFERTFGMWPDEFEKLPICEQYALLSLHSHIQRAAQAESFAASEFVSETAEDDSATVVYRTPEGKECRMRLVREGDTWLLARPRF